jgi:hypothetical protein
MMFKEGGGTRFAKKRAFKLKITGTLGHGLYVQRTKRLDGFCTIRLVGAKLVIVCFGLGRRIRCLCPPTHK